MAKKNPYLSDGRLGDVIAAIIVLGTYPFYKLTAARWSYRISGDVTRENDWRTVFKEHPEFFRPASDGDKFSLVWRRQFRRNYRIDDEPEIVPDYEIDGSTDTRISRRPLSPNEVTELIGVAIRLHDRALEQSKAAVWWLPLVVAGMSLVSVVVGAFLAAAFRP